MLKTFQKIDFANHPAPLFLTLTYPDEQATTSLAERNIHRKVMARHLERVTGAAIPAAWRVEWVPRKSGLREGEICPHWHWLIFRHRFIAYDAVNESWRKTIGADGYVRTQITRVDRRAVVQLYMAKYIAKDACERSLVIAAYQNKIGRQYGWLRKKEIPMQPEERHCKLQDDDRAALLGLAAERLPFVPGDREQSFTLFGDAVDDARRILGGETLDGG